MPSGAKKRKAARKKKQSGAHSKPPGVDVVKTQDSDGSGLSTPASQDQDSHQSPFDVGGEDLGKRDPSPIGSFAAGSKSTEGAAGNGDDGEKVVSEGECAVEVVRELDSQEGDENKVINIEHVQSSKGSSSSSSSSDDESREDEKEEKDEAGDSVVEEPSFTDLVSEQVNQVMEKETAEEVSDLHYKDGTSYSSNSSDDESRVHDKKEAEKEYNSAVEKPTLSAALVPKEASQPREEVPVEEVIDTVEPVVSVPEEEIHVKECVSVQNSVASESAVLAKSDGLVGASRTEVDSQSKTQEDTALPISYKNGEASSKVVSLSRDPSDKAGNGTEHVKTYDIPQYPENEHRLSVVPPRPVQKTSWKGCCGLFEVFMGSNR